MERFAQRDRPEERATGSEYAVHLGYRKKWIVQVLEDCVGKHDVEGAVREWQGMSIRLDVCLLAEVVCPHVPVATVLRRRGLVARPASEIKQVSAAGASLAQRNEELTGILLCSRAIERGVRNVHADGLEALGRVERA